MKGKEAGVVLTLLPMTSAMAQDQKAPEGDMTRNFPQAQLIRPTIPPQHYNFELHGWERETDSSSIEVKSQTQELSDVVAAPKQKVRRRKVQRRK